MKTPLITLLLTALLGVIFSASAAETKPAAAPAKAEPKEKKMEKIILASGCFWCGEAVLERIKGIESAVAGYTGGKTKNPTYEDICGGDTGHAECLLVEFDANVVTLDKVLEVFWHMHDPTTLNRQGPDSGTQYRSGIFYFNDAQKKTAEASKAAHAKDYKDPIVTEITAAGEFYKAEEYHQNYFENHFTAGTGNARYCRAIIWPKLKKLGLEKKEELEADK